MLEVALDLDDFDPETSRKAVANEGKLPPGKYHVRLESVQEKMAGNIPLTELHFVVIGGVHVGKEAVAKLWGTDKPANAHRLKLVMSAIGMIAKNKDGKWEFVEGKREFRDIASTDEMPGAECVVETALEERIDKNNPSKKYVNAEVTFDGFWNVNDKAVQSIVKGSLTTKPPERKVRPDVSEL